MNWEWMRKETVGVEFGAPTGDLPGGAEESHEWLIEMYIY
jgi:hypothetical protein